LKPKQRSDDQGTKRKANEELLASSSKQRLGADRFERGSTVAGGSINPHHTGFGDATSNT
jgi:hypothetical protein